MDWSKAKTILIIALLVTNIFLVATYETMGVKDNPEIMDQGTLIELLAQRGVYLETEIPKQAKDMELVPVEVLHSVELEVEALLASEGARELFNIKDTVSPEEWFNISDADVSSAYVDAAVDFITALGFMDEGVRLKEIYLNDNNYVLIEFKNIYQGLPLEESTMVCTFNEGDLIDLDALWLKALANNRKKVSVMDPAVALLALVGEKKEEEKWIVRAIELAYWLNLNSRDIEGTVTDTAFPAWCITYNDGEKMYFTAAQI